VVGKISISFSTSGLPVFMKGLCGCSHSRFVIKRQQDSSTSPNTITNTPQPAGNDLVSVGGGERCRR
jgi:hypothetical protein